MIKDFDATAVVLQLSDGVSDYQQQTVESNLRLSKGDDLIAIIENSGYLDLDGAGVAFA